MPSPFAGVASGTIDISLPTPLAVSSAVGSSMRVTTARSGTGHARNKNSTAARTRHNMRTPNARAMAPATNSGIVSRSMRYSQ